MANLGKNFDSEDIWSVERESCRRFDAFFKRLHSVLNRVHFAIEIGFEYLLRFLRIPRVQFCLGILAGLAVLAMVAYMIYLMIAYSFGS